MNLGQDVNEFAKIGPVKLQLEREPICVALDRRGLVACPKAVAGPTGTRLGRALRVGWEQYMKRALLEHLKTLPKVDQQKLAKELLEVALLILAPSCHKISQFPPPSPRSQLDLWN